MKYLWFVLAVVAIINCLLALTERNAGLATAEATIAFMALMLSTYPEYPE